MKKILLALVVLGMSFVSCENSDITDEISAEEIQAVEPGDDGTIDPGGEEDIF